MTNSFSHMARLREDSPKCITPQSPIAKTLLGLTWCLCILNLCTHVVPAHAQGPVKARAADFIVAVVNSEPITNNEVQSFKLRLEKQAAPGSATPNAKVLAQQALEQLILEKAQLQQARENGIRIDEAEVDLAEANIARQNQVSKEELRKRVAADGLSTAAFREQLRNQLIINRLREREVDNRARISDTDVEQFIQSKQTGGAAEAMPIDLNLAMILIAVPEDASDKQVAELQTKAQQISERAKSGENFASLAAAVSQAADKGANGGEMGLRPADRYPTLFVESVQKLGKGDISAPVKSGAGFHILKLVTKRASSVVTVTQTHPRHILLRPGGQLSQTTARAQLAEYKRQIEAGKADFAKLAREHSQDASGPDGGDLGWVSPGMFVPEFEEVMNKLQPGQIADPMVSRFGVHLIQVLERREAPISERELRDMARNSLREKKFDETYQLWAQEVRGRAYVEYRDAPQ